MKLATLHDGSRDGQLVVVARDLRCAHFASHIAGTLQRVLDDWNFLSPQLEDLYATLNGGKARHAFAFDPRACLAPLPRAFLWVPDGRRPARGDSFLRPVGSTGPRLHGLALQVAWVAVTGDVAADADEAAALDGIRLLTLTATWHDGDIAVATACSPVAATPDELGAAWQPAGTLPEPALRRQGTLLQPTLDEPAARARSSADDLRAPRFGSRLAALARGAYAGSGSGSGSGSGVDTGLAAGSLVGGPSLPAGGQWQAGHRLQVELLAADGHSVFGAIDLRDGAAGQAGGAGGAGGAGAGPVADAVPAAAPTTAAADADPATDPATA